MESDSVRWPARGRGATLSPRATGSIARLMPKEGHGFEGRRVGIQFSITDLSAKNRRYSIWYSGDDRNCKSRQSLLFEITVGASGGSTDAVRKLLFRSSSKCSFPEMRPRTNHFSWNIIQLAFGATTVLIINTQLTNNIKHQSSCPNAQRNPLSLSVLSLSRLRRQARFATPKPTPATQHSQRRQIS